MATKGPKRPGRAKASNQGQRLGQESKTLVERRGSTNPHKNVPATWKDVTSELIRAVVIMWIIYLHHDTVQFVFRQLVKTLQQLI
jgi:hypothetical protein